jgi:hypothetical protein
MKTKMKRNRLSNGNKEKQKRKVSKSRSMFGGWTLGSCDFVSRFTSMTTTPPEIEITPSNQKKELFLSQLEGTFEGIKVVTVFLFLLSQLSHSFFNKLNNFKIQHLTEFHFDIFFENR